EVLVREFVRRKSHTRIGVVASARRLYAHDRARGSDLHVRGAAEVEPEGWREGYAPQLGLVAVTVPGRRLVAQPVEVAEVEFGHGVCRESEIEPVPDVHYVPVVECVVRICTWRVVEAEPVLGGVGVLA